MRQHPLVLIVDDEEIFLEIASTKLKECGCETIVTHDAAEALREAESLEPDLILSDVYMAPGLSGWDLALALHENPKTKDIKFAFFTSLRDPWMELANTRRTDARKLGTVTFLSKMDDVHALAERVLGILRS